MDRTPDAHPATLPSLAQQKTYIIEQCRLLDRGAKLAILSLVMTEIADSESPSSSTATEGRDGVYINLDSISNTDLVANIYNIVHAHHMSLNSPV